MILNSLAHAGSVPFPNEITVQWDALPETVAIYGPNGAGKTMLVELLPMALFLTAPFRPGPLYKHFVKRGYIKYGWTLGDERLTSTVLVDPRAERVEAMLTGPTGPIAGPKQSDYRAAVEDRIGSLDLFCMRAYAVQPSYTSSTAVSLLKASRAERREVMAELLSLGQYAAREGYAKRKGEALAIKRDQVEDALKTARDAVASEPDIRELLRFYEASAGAITLELEATIQTIALLRARGAVIRAEIKAAETETARRVAARADLEIRISRLQFEAEALRGRLEQKPTILAAVSDRDVLRMRVRVQEEQIARATTAVVAAEAVERLRAEKTGEQRTQQQRVEALNRQVLIKDQVPCGGGGIYAACQFLLDAARAEGQLPEALRALQASIQALAAVPPRNPAPTAELTRLRAEKAQLDTALRTVSDLAEKAGRLDADERTLANYETELTVATGQLEALAPPAEISPPDLRLVVNEEQQLGSVVLKLRQLQARADQAVGRYVAQLERIAEQRLLVGPLERESDELARDLEDWSLLARACHPSGIPARKVDRALPMIEQVANQLLTCFPDPFSVSFVTQKRSADETKLLETLECLVRRNGETVPPEFLSGAQGVIVSEAISLAITLVQRQGNMALRTLLRDEVSAPMDATSAPLYVDMLRLAMRTGQFHQGIFVTHHAGAIQRADARLLVEDGRVTRQ